MEIQDRKPKKKPIKIEDMTKEQIRQAILKKRECNAKAQTIVENLIESGISEDYFLTSLLDINQSHFEDVIEERAIVSLCGYPICSKTLSEKDIPKQQYRISLKTNKVYDITTRKSFCSNACYKSAMHIKQQMLTSPLWFREYENIPKFHLMPLDSVGSLGQEVDVALIQRVQIRNKSPFTSINDFANASLHDIVQEDAKEENKEKLTQNTVQKDSKEVTIDNKVQNKAEELIQENSNSSDNIKNKEKNPKPIEEQRSDLRSEEMVTTINTTVIEPKQFTKVKKPSNPLNIIGDIIEKPEKKIDPILISSAETQSSEEVKPEIATSRNITLSAKQLRRKKPPSVTAIIIEVEKCLAEWFTLDTLLFLFGGDRVMEMVTDKGECIKEYLNNYSKSISYNANTYDQYQTLCRKLNMLELEDRRYDAKTLNRETKPLPDYSIIKEESKRLQLKVKAFLAGETDIPDVNVTEESKTPEDDSNTTQLPLVDKSSQNALRRRIVCNHLNQVLSELLRTLGLLTLFISGDVKLLVNTFKLQANNIMFKPIQWTLIAIVIIKLLSLRDRRLDNLLQTPTAYQHMQLLLLSYKQDGGYLDRLISWLTDIDRLLDTNDTQLTIE